MKYVAFFVFLFIGLIPKDGLTTHNRAGEITFVQTGPLTIEMTITTYTKASSTSVDRDSLEVHWGDASMEVIPRKDITILDNDVKKNRYTAIHTYPSPATFTIFFMDPNRVENILNVNPPNSVDIPFYLETQFTFVNTQFQGINNSPILLQPPLDFACVGKRFVHNPSAFDADGDSLAYELVVPLQMKDSPVPNYSFPSQISPGLNNQTFLNPITGAFTWDAPQLQGEYNIAILVKEYRNGVLLSQIIRDMQIFVRVCNNEPPTIDVIDEICVVAGTELVIDLTIDDPDLNQMVKISASGGPISFGAQPATITNDSTYLDISYQSQITWQTSCADISPQYYQIVVRAIDNFLITDGLSTSKTIRIKVVGPPPENLDTKVNTDFIRLEWDFPYFCDAAENMLGFSVWRKQLSTPFPIDTCIAGLDGRGYEKIVFNTTLNDGSMYFYEDIDVESGETYCYRVLGEFAKLTSTGNPFNATSSLPSNEACQQLSRDIPLITKVSVTSTNNTNGTIEVTWTKPVARDLDTLQNPGPYRYTLLRSLDQVNFQAIAGADFSTTFFNQDIDTSFTDEGLNTFEEQYFYRVDFYTGGQLHGSAQSASSVFLTTLPRDEAIDLSWDYTTPWQNYSYTVYRKGPTSASFDSIAIVNEENYSDRQLVNGTSYCYYVKATGTYGLDNVMDPLINLSQEACAVPIDNEEPCPPDSLTISSICDELSNLDNLEELANLLFWPNPNITCEETNDVIGYKIYYKINKDLEFQLLAEKNGANNTDFEHLLDEGTAGCYAVSAIDSIGNESPLSNEVCVENCPIYELPNTFTPNGDGFNDLFVPLKTIFVDHVEFELFNSWGNKIFSTDDANLNWDGKNLNGKDCADGTYYYSCRIFESTTEGIQQADEPISGFIHLIRG